MECMLLPKDPTAPLTKVPHIDQVKYDGGDWFSYPQRRNEEWPMFDPDNGAALYQYMHSLPNSRQVEPFLQTWLLFGLLSEFFGNNAPKISETSLAERPHEVALNEVVRRLYDSFTYKDGDRSYVTTATLLQDMEEEVKRRLSNRDAFRDSCIRLRDCLRMAWQVLKAVPPDFDPIIRASIGVVAEILSHSMNYAFLLYKLPITCPIKWTTTYFNEEPLRYDRSPGVRETMLSNGWCPSDISRSMNNFNSLQMFHFLGKMNRSFPPRDHSQCNDTHCAAYQINQNYKVRHVDPGCTCKLVHVDNSAIIGILEKEERIPLLRFVGGIEDLKIEIVQSSQNTPYVAISHVWADGLGNQHANALNSCELIRLRTLVEVLGRQEASMTDPFLQRHDVETTFIWIDTLCCPVESSKGKKMAIEKIRHVYQYARHVLVLDASLESYKAHEMQLVEQMARIFTSGWLRRLWTLQEGALAESLYFQFADCAVSLDLKKLQLTQLSNNLRHRIFFFEFFPEYMRLQSFYHYDRLSNTAKTNRSPPDLSLVNAALQYRSVSVPSDEPLCVACLMSLSTKPMLEKDVPENDRMKILWKLIAEKYGGIPASIIFFEDIRIDAPGWRWALASLLTSKPQLQTVDTRILKWSDKNLGLPTSNGLRVKLPGYRITLGQIDDGKLRHPWKGVARLPEIDLYCRDVDSKQWYLIVDNEYALKSTTWTKEALKEYNERNRFPMNDLISKGDCFIIQSTSVSEGILARFVPLSERSSIIEPQEGIPVTTQHHIIFKEATHAQTIFQNAIESMAQELRNDQLTEELSALESQDGRDGTEEHANTLKALKEKMKEMMRKAIEQNLDLGPAIDSIWGSKWRDLAWVCIGDWYYHDFKISKMPADQIWYVD